MTALVHRRNVLRGLLAAPAIVAANSLMPIRGVVMFADPLDSATLGMGYNVASIRDLLLPGLRCVVGDYKQLGRWIADIREKETYDCLAKAGADVNYIGAYPFRGNRGEQYEIT